jgi:DNA-binding GntR family transcriptional regulator
MDPTQQDQTPLGAPFTPQPSRTDAVAAHLRDAIVAGRLAAGQKLHLDGLARQFGVSRMPVRDALKILEAEGLVEILPYRGIKVTTLNPDDIKELFGLREVLEQTAIERAIARLSTAQLDRMESLLTQMDSLGDDERWLDLNAEFHAVLNGACGWPRLVDMIDQLRANVERYLRAYVVGSGCARPQAQHWALYRACRARDPETARAVIAEHLRDTASALLGTLSRNETGAAEAPSTERPD